MRIGEAATKAGMTTKTLRYYEERGLLPGPGRTANGYREYGEDTVSRLGFIRRGRAAGLSLAQLGEILAVRDRGRAPCTHIRDLLAAQLGDLDRQISELKAVRVAVAEAHETAAAGDPAACDGDRICSYL